MACLAAKLYDPASVATFDGATLSAMTALDTTNLRVSFTAPANGCVYARLKFGQKGATTNPNILLGVLEGSTVRGRMAPLHGRVSGSATSMPQYEAVFPVTGLTAGNTYTWDAAASTQFAVAASTLGWGGPNDTTSNDAYGAAAFEVFDAPNLIGSKMYDPATADTSHVASSPTVMAAIDTTNLRHTFVAPSSGFVMGRIRGVISGAASTMAVHWGIMESTTIVARSVGTGGNVNNGTLAATDWYVYESTFVVPGVTAGTHTWDAAFGVEVHQVGASLRFGGPNDASGTAYGAFCYDLWSV